MGSKYMLHMYSTLYTSFKNRNIPLCFRYEQLAEQEEHSYQHLRRKLYSELQQERDRLTAEMHGQRDLLERQMKELKVTQTYIYCTLFKASLKEHSRMYVLYYSMQDSYASQLDQMKSDQESLVAEIHRRHGVKLSCAAFDRFSL